MLAEVLPGVLFVRWVQREFEDLLAVLMFSPVGGYIRLPTDRREVGKCCFIYRKRLYRYNLYRVLKSADYSKYLTPIP